PALGFGWWGDDPVILEKAICENPLDFFWNRELYQQFSPWNFTPMVIASFALDYTLFGLEPSWFHAHQIMVLGLIAAGIFLVVSRWGRAVALVTGLLFLSTGQAAVTARTLMTRHYIEGACWALVSVLLMLSAERPGWRTRLAGLAYLLATLSKEVYAPLVVMAPLLSPTGLRRGLRLSLPLWAALAAYASLRLFMLAGTAGHWQFAWSGVVEPGWWLRRARGIAAMLCSRSTGVGMETWIELAVGGAALALLVLLLRSRRLLMASVIAASSFASLLPVSHMLHPSDYPSYRLTLHVAVAAAVGFGYLLAAATRIRALRGPLRALPAVALGSTAVVVALQGQFELGSLLKHSQLSSSREMGFVLTESADQVLVLQQSMPYWEALARIRRRVSGEATPPVCDLPYDLRGADSRYVRYSTHEDRFVDITFRFRAARKVFLSLRSPAAFSVDLRVSGGSASLQLDKGRVRGAYWLLRGWVSNTYEATPVPPVLKARGYFSLYPSFVRLLKINEDGGWVSSPEWRIDLNRDRTIHWEH
ncbi:MAG: hypothetical protein ACE5F1_05390, partial [Planctomycetota bacterium]